MAREPTDKSDLDRTAYDMADRHFQAVRESLPPEMITRLAKEVVRRLAFRATRDAAAPTKPTAEEIDKLCRALVSRDERAGDRIILSAWRAGAGTQTIYLGYIAAAARRLGEMWESDEVTFVEVTLATSRLYRIMRGLRHVLDEAIHTDRENRHVFFALVPQETHTLGIEIATEFFRRDGWDVHMAVGKDQDALVREMEAARYESLVFIAHSEGMLQELIALVVAARIVQPLAPIVVAGNIVNQVANVDVVVGADAVMEDIGTAVSTLRNIVDVPGKATG